MISFKRIVQVITPHRLSVQVPIVRRNLTSPISIEAKRANYKFNSFILSRLRSAILKRREVSIFFLPSNNAGSMTTNGSDPSSHSRPDLAKIRHASLSLEIDFERKIFKGHTVLTFNTLDVLNELVLDVSKGMEIKSILLEDGTELKYAVDKKDSVVGSRLVIHLDQPAGKDDFCQTLPECDKAEQSDIKPDPQYYSPTINKHLPLSYNNFGYHPALTLNKPSFTLHKASLDPENENNNSSRTCASSTYSAGSNNCDRDVHASRNSNEKDCSMALAKYEAAKIKMTGFPKKTSAYKPEVELFDIRFKVTINYATSPTASALQWLEPEQTAGKTFPYVFSQCQPIHARSIMPCQDTPSVKFTYDAEITVPENFTVLMSALRDGQAFSKTLQRKESCTHKFKQPVPIPSYLLAIVVGVLQWKIIGPRTVVWAEGSVVERAAAEFSETEKYLEAAESLVGPYVWTQYDLLVLPPSFPYGGMENPCLTFVTPTLLAGDKSQADVIVHEIMHSWSGNLVTNKNFEHFWLNEGFTVFLERKVTAALAPKADRKKLRDFESILGLQELEEAVKVMEKVNGSYTQLIPNLEGVNPDDAFSTVPYEKGSLFLRYLEDLVGGTTVFEKFVRDYINNFTRTSIDSYEFKDFFMKYFESNPKIQEIQWDQWFYSQGMPPIIPEYDHSMTNDVLKLVDKIHSSDHEIDCKDIAKFKSNQMIYLLQVLITKPPLETQKLSRLGEAYGVSRSPNTEIKFRWYRLNIKSNNKDILKDVFTFLSHVGRMKYARPLYRDLYAWEDVRQQAIDNFLKTEPTMMHVLAYTLRGDLHLKPKDVDSNQ